VLVARVDRASMRQETGTVIVNDGDTITLNGQRIRLIGMDAPEYHQTCIRDSRSYPCGRQAREMLVKLIAGQPVTCEGGKWDRYHRLLAVCTAGGLDLNRAMVEQGWAVAYGGYEDAERLAAQRSAGIWAGTFERPRDWRARQNAREDEPGGDIWRGIVDWLREILRFS